MDSALIEFIEEHGDLYGDDALVWCPVTPEARETHQDAYIISRNIDHDFTGCMYIGSVGGVKKEIATLQEFQNKPITVNVKRFSEVA